MLATKASPEKGSEGSGLRLTVQAPEGLAPYISRKGSICLDGVSLTVNAANGSVFEIQIIPHTLSATIVAHYQRGSRVNVEVDLIARYLERLMQYSR
jgi:riboflavin synthase